MNKKQNGFFRSDILTIESIAKEKSRQMCKWHPQGSSRSRTNGTPSGEIHGFRFIYNRKYYTRKNKNRTEKLNPQGSSEGVPSVRRMVKFICSDLFQIEKYCEEKWMPNGESERRRRLPDGVRVVRRVVRFTDSALFIIENIIRGKIRTERRN